MSLILSYPSCNCDAFTLIELLAFVIFMDVGCNNQYYVVNPGVQPH